MSPIPAYLHGVHDTDGVGLMDGFPGWVVITEAIGHEARDKSGRDYSEWSRRGLGVVVRLNNAHDGVNGTIPLPDQYNDFAFRCANFVAASTGIDVVIIGNEPNHSNEWPRRDGQKAQIDPHDYARCYSLCRSAIRGINAQIPVLVAAIAPWNNESGDWLHYLRRVINQLWEGTHGFALHAYTHGADPALIFSDEMQHGWYWHFRVYRQQMVAIREIIKSQVQGMLFLITETNQGDGPWADVDSGWVQNAYKEISDWNGLQPSMPIAGLALYRSNRDDKWSFADKEGVKKDFRAAVEQGYPSPQISGQKPADPDETQFLPAISTGGDNPAPPTKPESAREIDPRLVERGVTIDEESAAPGMSYWRLVRARWWDESEAGGRHHIYVEALDENGQPIAGVPFRVMWPGDSVDIKTNGRSGFDAANFPMSPSLKEFGVQMMPLLSDRVDGIGMGANGNPGIHTSTGLTFQRVTVPQAQPAPQPTPPAPSPAPVPILAHPVSNPALRTVSQRFGENPADYERFGLAGHTGIDFAVPEGTPVSAVADGVVQEAGNLPDYGNYVKLRHPWGESLYAHLSKLLVSQGEPVSAGERIALSGNSGNSTGPHLHYAMRLFPYTRGAPFDGFSDPAPYLINTATPAPSQPAPAPTADLLALLKLVAMDFGLDWNLLASLAWGESSWRPQAEGGGLFQLGDGAWADWAARVGAKDRSNALDNARVAAAYFSWLLRRYRGNERLALWAWNWGPSRVDAGGTAPALTQEFANKILHGRDLLHAVGA